jgi:hypothetical protein
MDLEHYANKDWDQLIGFILLVIAISALTFIGATAIYVSAHLLGLTP